MQDYCLDIKYTCLNPDKTIKHNTSASVDIQRPYCNLITLNNGVFLKRVVSLNITDLNLKAQRSHVIDFCGNRQHLKQNHVSPPFENIFNVLYIFFTLLSNMMHV